MIYDGITCESMARETGISRQLIEYWDSKYRYDVIDEVEREARQRRKKKSKKGQHGIDMDQVQEGLNKRSDT